MDKQIEEMAKVYCCNEYSCNNNCVHKKREDCEIYATCEELYKAGYRKLGDNAIRVLRSAKDMEKHIRKETARKFADMLKDKLGDFLECNEGIDGKIDKVIAILDVIGVETIDGEVVSKGLIEYIYEEIVGDEDGNESGSKGSA